MRAFDGEASPLTEMDALVAYLQMLGRLTDAAYKPVAAVQREPSEHGHRRTTPSSASRNPSVCSI